MNAAISLNAVARVGKETSRGTKWNRADKYDSIAPDLHKQPFPNEHAFTS